MFVEPFWFQNWSEKPDGTPDFICASVRPQHNEALRRVAVALIDAAKASLEVAAIRDSLAADDLSLS